MSYCTAVIARPATPITLLWSGELAFTVAWYRPIYILLTNEIHKSESFLTSWQFRRQSRSFVYFIESGSFITVCTTARKYSLSCARGIHFALSRPTSLRSVLTLFSHLWLGFPCCLFPSSLPINPSTNCSPHSSIPPSPHPHPSWFNDTKSMWLSLLIIKLLNMQISSTLA